MRVQGKGRKQSILLHMVQSLKICAHRWEGQLSVSYMLRFLGIIVDYLSLAYGDDQEVICNATISSRCLKKTYVVILFHKTCEVTASEIEYLVKIK